MYSGSVGSSRSPNTSILDQTNLRTQRGSGKKWSQIGGESWTEGGRGFYAQHAAGQEGDDGAACAWRSVKGSEKGEYEGRIRRGRLPSDVGFTCPTTPIARHPADCSSALFSAGQSPPIGYAEPITAGSLLQRWDYGEAEPAATEGRVRYDFSCPEMRGWRRGEIKGGLVAVRRKKWRDGNSN